MKLIIAMAFVLMVMGCGTKGKPLSGKDSEDVNVNEGSVRIPPPPVPTVIPEPTEIPDPLPMPFISFDTTDLFIDPFPPLMAKPLPLVKPSWCGLSTIADSDGINEVYSIPCHGKLPKSECPTGFTQLSVGLLPFQYASKAGTLYTCIPNAHTLIPLSDDDSSWCGFGFSNKGAYTSFAMDGGRTSGSGVSCMGHDVLSSCPSGYNKASFKTTSNGADTAADTFGVCVRKPNGGGKIANAGGWFGFAGTPGKPAASNGSFNIQFAGKNIIDECPSSSNDMARVVLKSSAFNPLIQEASSKSIACIFTP